MTFDELWGRSTPNSWARVPRGPVAAAVGTWLFGATSVAFTVGATAVTWGTIGGFLITTAVTSWALSALTPKPPGTTEQTLGNVREAVGDFDIVYGEVRKGGTITFMETSDRIGYKRFKDDYLHFIIVLAGHEVEEIGDIYFDDEKVTLDSEGFAIGDRWKSRARVKKHLGSPNQLADPDLVAETSVDSSFRGRGIAYLYVRLDWDGNVFTTGTPNITAMVKGKKVYDPRSNTTAWTDNAALCIRDYLEQPFGLNSIQSPSSLGSSDWVTAANVSDTLVTRKNGSKEKRYTLNGVVSTANTPRTNLQNMLTSCGGTLFWGQGQWQFKAGYFPSGPYVSFDADDLRSGISLVTKNSRKENFNAVTGTFLDKTQDYIEVDYPKVESSVFLERDNGQTNTLDMSLPYTTSSSAAQRLAKMALFRSREEIVISADFGLKAAKVKVGDVVQFTFERYGFTNKYFEVVSWKPVTDNGELKINLILKETSAAAYDWNAEEKDILGNNTNLPDPTSGLDITNLSVTNRQTLQSDGSFLGEVVLSWDAADSAFVDRYVVQWKKSVDTSWSATETHEISIVIPSVKSGVPHDYRVKAVNFAGFSGPWEQLTTTVDGKETPPGIPTNLQAKNLYRGVEVYWVNPTDRDLNHIEIWGGATNNVGSATLLGKSGGTRFVFNMEPMEKKWFFVRAVDNSNNKSAFTTGVMGTALFIDRSDVDIDVGQLLDDAGLSAVEVLPNLPTSNNYDGRTVYNTDDRQLYIYDGNTGTWKPAVEPFNPDDLVLESDNFPSDLKPVEVLSSLPTTGNFEGRVVMLLSDGKLYRYKDGAFTASVPTVDLTGTIVANQIANNAITETKISDDAISTPKLKANAITAGKIASNAITTDKLEANAVTAGKIATNAITTDKLEANAVTTAKIAAGAISADKIQANSILASKIAIGDINNLIIDSDLQDEAYWNKPTNVSLSTAYGDVTPWAKSKGAFLVYPPTDTSTPTFITTNNIPVKPGEEFLAKVTIAATHTHSSRVFLQILDKDTTFLTNFFSDTYTGTAFNDVEVSATIPTNGRYVRFVLYVLPNGYASNRVVFSGPVLRRKSGGELIVDGAITAAKISANSVGTNHLVANAVTAGIIAAGAVSAAAIQSGAVTADKINVNNLAAISANLGSIQVGSANIADGAITSAKIVNGAITNAKISNVIQSNNFVTGDGGTGWRIDKNGTAEFNNVIIRRQIEVASGTVNVGNFTPSSTVMLANGPGKTEFVLTTPIPMTAWQGAKKTYLATAGMTGTVSTLNSSDCYWGWTAEVLPLTKWSGNQSLRLKLDFWGNHITNVSNCVITWKIYEVS